MLGPTWQVETSGSLQVYLQPKLTLYLYSVAGVSGDLQPHLELDGNAQTTPPQWDLALYGGLTSTVGLDLRVWDSSWGDLPDKTWNLIPKTLLWETGSSPSAPEITGQPSDQWVATGDNATFTVTANGAGLTYRWMRNRLYLTDDNRISGSQSPLTHGFCYRKGTVASIACYPKGKATNGNSQQTGTQGNRRGSAGAL